MNGVVLGARLILAAVFGVAGAAKLADRPGTRRALVDFGVPAAFWPVLSLLLPLTEFAIAGALTAGLWVWWAAWAALALLALFSAALGWSVLRGRAVDCHCFGRISSGPVSARTLLRNLLLMLPAVLLLRLSGDHLGPSLLSGDASVAEQILLAGAIVLLAIGVRWVLGQQSPATTASMESRRSHGWREAFARLVATGHAPAQAAPGGEAGLPVGSPAPSFALPDLNGETVTLADCTHDGRPLLLLFTDPNCRTCHTLQPELGAWQRRLASRLTVVLVSRGEVAANGAIAAEHGLRNVLLQQDREVAAAYRAFSTPAAVLVRPDGTLGSGVVAGPAAIRELVAQTTGAAVRHVEAPRLQVGDPAPPLHGVDQYGLTFDLAAQRDERTLLVFYNPGCGFCAEVLADLRAWSPAAAPRLVVVAGADAKAARMLGLDVPVLPDSHLLIQQRFAVAGTPAAVLVDTDGRALTSVARGVQAVRVLLALVAAPPTEDDRPARTSATGRG